MDVAGTMVVVGLARWLFHIYNMWQMCAGGVELAQQHESSLKFMMHMLGYMSDGKGMWGWLLVVCVCMRGADACVMWVWYASVGAGDT